MKHLYILSTIYSSVNYSFEIDSIISDVKENEVTVLQCDSCVDKCNGNTFGLGILCSECRKRSNSVLKLINNIKIVKTSDYSDKGRIYEKFSYSSLKELNKIVYKGVEIGYGVASYYISLTRNLNPQITPKLKKILDEWLLSSMRYADIADKVITPDYDMVYVVNGRMFESKPYQEIAFAKGVRIILGESMTNLNGNNVRMNFDNVRVHSVTGNCKAIENFWKNSNVSVNEKIKIASSFYEKRASAIATYDKIYVKKQKKGLMPDDWDEDKINIAIFNSSEDEFAAIGGEFEKNNIFDSQMSGITYMLDNVKDNNIHFYLRIHPNLMHIPYKYHKDLYKLPMKYKNITIIPGDSPISSYSLLYACDRAITFGSTMGVEAAYVGKSTMVVRPCFYYYLNVNYVPKNKQDILDFIFGKIEFIPSREDALKYSYYYFNDERGFVENKECKLCKFNIWIGKWFSLESMRYNCSNFRMKYVSLLCLLGIASAKLLISRKER